MFDCCSIGNPKLATQIRDWKTRFDGLFEELRTDFSVCAHVQQIASAAAPEAEVLLQPIQHSGFVGSTIQSAQMDVQAWISEVHPQARMVGIYGMGSVGKTSLLKLVYNHFKEERGKGIFDVVIWLTISQQYEIKNLQASIAETLHLKLEGVTGEMGASDNYSSKIQPLSIEEGLVLFNGEAFRNGVVPKESIQGIAKEIASECGGLPLALNVVAAAMRLKKTEDEWKRALNLMRKVDPSFGTRHSSIDTDLYQRLKWSYDELTDPNLKISFLYCAVFPEDAEFDVETLVEMWSAEKLVTDMDAGQEYIDALVGRCLFEYVVSSNYRNNQVEVRNQVKVHDIVHDLAIYIGRSEEQWLFAMGQHVQDFPREDEIGNCQRISLGHNDIRVLPTSLACPKLVSLVLANNKQIREVKEGFFSAARSLKVLDLSDCISITTLPTSLGQLEQLEFLNLSGCSSLEKLPEDTSNLSRLRFLHLEGCESLNSLPDSIGGLRNLKHLNLGGCDSLMAIPHGISHLTSLNKLFLPRSKKCAVSVEDIANLSNLTELRAAVKSEIKESTMTTWTDLRRLKLLCIYDGHIRDDVVEEHIFPINMDNLNKLEHFILSYYVGVSLPHCISQLQNLRVLNLYQCPELRKLPACQIGNATVVGGFPVLKRLHLHRLDKLESMMVGSFVVSSQEIMPQLEDIYINDCISLKKLRTKKLPCLKNLTIQYCKNFEALEIESGGLPALQELRVAFLDRFETLVGPKLQRLVVMRCPLFRRLSLDNLPYLRHIELRICRELRELHVGTGVFPRLERLELVYCEKLGNIVGPDDVSADETMPKLQSLDIVSCPLLRTLPRGMDKLWGYSSVSKRNG